ncbi:MAG: aminopeptidase P family protein [Candidatus Lokiarchaeota archaeon]|nr:aminopeptidase P family protein [Candidatus Lokiarchaeota archaeon]
MSVERIKKIVNNNKFNNIDALLITKPENIIYILGFNVQSETSILIPNMNPNKLDKKIIIFLNILEYDEVKYRIEQNIELNNKVELVKVDSNNKSILQEKIYNSNIKMLGFEDNYITIKEFKDFTQRFENITLLNASDIINEARLIKTKEEIDNIKNAAQLGIIGLKRILEDIKEGKTEIELAAEAEYEMRRAGSEGTSFDTIVASGHRSAFPHAKTSEKPIKNGDVIIVDLGAKYNGYCSDMTRTFIFNGKNSKNFEKKAELINLVNDCEKFILDQIKDNKKAVDLDGAARKFFKNKKMEWSSRFIHSLGHGVGIDIHEFPYLSNSSNDILKEGMCITIEPGLYIPNLGGARTEDLIIIKKKGYNLLTNTEKFYY